MGIENINFRSLSPFGMEANEISITDISDKDLVSLKHIIANNCFIVFRKQSVSDAEFVAFLNRLGPMTFTVGETPVVDQPALNVVTNVGRDRFLPDSRIVVESHRIDQSDSEWLA